MVGKWESRNGIEAVTPSGDPHTHRLFKVQDKDTGHSYLVDSGAQVSVSPPTAAERKNGPVEGMLLQAANELEHMLELGIIRPSKSNYASPLHMVP